MFAEETGVTERALLAQMIVNGRRLGVPESTESGDQTRKTGAGETPRGPLGGGDTTGQSFGGGWRAPGPGRAALARPLTAAGPLPREPPVLPGTRPSREPPIPPQEAPSGPAPLLGDGRGGRAAHSRKKRRKPGVLGAPRASVRYWAMARRGAGETAPARGRRPAAAKAEAATPERSGRSSARMATSARLSARPALLGAARHCARPPARARPLPPRGHRARERPDRKRAPPLGPQGLRELGACPPAPCREPQCVCRMLAR